MTRFRFALFALPALFMLTAPFAPCSEEKKAEPKPVNFVSKEGKFSVTLPEKPAEKKSKVKVGEGELDHFVFTVGQKDRAQIVTYIDYPKGVVGEDRDKFLAGVVERNAASLKGKVASDEKATVGKKNHPARDVVIEMPDKKGLYRARIILAGDRLYQVVALGPEEFVKGKAVDEYLKSFTIDE